MLDAIAGSQAWTDDLASDTLANYLTARVF